MKKIKKLNESEKYRVSNSGYSIVIYENGDKIFFNLGDKGSFLFSPSEHLVNLFFESQQDKFDELDNNNLPQNLNNDNNGLIKLSISELRLLRDNCIKNEDYEKAELYKQKLKNLGLDK